MERVLVQGKDNIENVFETLIFETGVNSLKAKTFIFRADHILGVSQWISGEKIYIKKNNDGRDRIMRYFSLLQV